VPLRDADLCFTMSVIDERELVEDRVARISRVYPGSHVVLLPDGTHTAGRPWPDVGVSVRSNEERLYAVENGGLVVQRHLEAFLDSGARWWFKVDPDTVVWRRFGSLPDGICFFGTMQGGRPGPSLQGGCIGGTQAAARALLESAALLSPALLDPESSWAHGNPFLLARAARGLVSFDFVHAWACRQAGIPLQAHAEIRSEWKQPPLDPSQHAVSHPHKTVDVDGEQLALRARLEVSARLVELIEANVPAHATVAVVSKGDDCLAELGERVARHFPADETGAWAGFHPRDSEHAIALLAREQTGGADHFALPDTGAWWLEYYDGLARHLESRHRLVAQEPGAGRIWALEELG
jgi:hypothetical protein